MMGKKFVNWNIDVGNIDAVGQFVEAMHEKEINKIYRGEVKHEWYEKRRRNGINRKTR